MKINVTLVVDVEPRKWANSNGLLVDGDGRYKLADVRADIQSYFLNLAQCSAMTEETGAEIRIRK